MSALPAVSSSIYDAKSRGLSDEQALLLGIASGSIEYITEKFSIETLLKPANGFFHAVGRNFLAEGSEEGSSALLNLVADVIIAGDESKFIASLEQYRKENNVSEKEAFKHQLVQELGNIGYEALIGGLVGSILGGGNFAIYGAASMNAEQLNEQYANFGKILKSGNIENIQAILDYAAELPDTKLSQIALNNNTDNIDDVTLGMLYTAVEQDIMGKYLEVKDLETKKNLFAERYNATDSRLIKDIEYKMFTESEYISSVLDKIASVNNNAAKDTQVTEQQALSDTDESLAETGVVEGEQVTQETEQPVVGGDSVESASESVLPNVSAAGPEADPMVDWAYEEQGVQRLTDDQKYIKSVAKLLGREVEFKNLDKTVTDKNGKRVRVSPDGYFDKDTGKIYINSSKNSTGNALLFVFKHELTHFAESDLAAYTDFANGVMDSQIFKDWVKSKGFQDSVDADGKPVSAAMKMNENYRDRYGKSGLKGTEVFNDPQKGEDAANREMVADFVAEKLFSNNITQLGDALSNVQPANVNKFKQFILNILQKLKDVFAKRSDKFVDIASIEKEFIKTCEAAKKAWEQKNVSETEQTENTAQNKKSTAEGGRQYSVKKSFSEQVDDVIDGSHNPRFDLYVSETPQYLVKLKFTKGPLLMRNSKVSEILSKHPEMSEETIKSLPKALEEPLLVLKSKTHPTESVVVITDVMTSKGEMIIPVWVNQEGSYIDIELGEVNTNTNFVASSYGRNIKALLEYANEHEGFLYQNDNIEKVRQLLARNGLQLPTPLKLSNSDIIVPQSDTVVNSNSMQESGDYSENKQYSISNDVDRYTEKQYNNFGWVRYNDVLSPGEYETLLSRYADYKHNKNNYPTTRFGEAVIHSSEYPDVIMYVKGTVKNPQITKVVRINADVSKVKEMILRYEDRNDYRTLEIVRAYYGDWILDTDYKRNYASFQEYRTETKGSGGKTSNTVSGVEQNGTRGTQQNTETDRADLNDESAFSMPENKQYSLSDNKQYSLPDNFSELSKMFKNGQLTEEEFRAALEEKSSDDNPVSIANLKPEDANTTPELTRKEGTNQGNKTSNLHASLLGSSIFNDEFKQDIKDDSYIKSYQAVTNKESLRKAADKLDEGGRKAVEQWWSKPSDETSLVDIAMGLILMDRYQRVGDTVSAAAAAQKLRAMGTSSGQQVQIFSILGRFTPDTMVYYAQKTLSDALEAMKTKKLTNWVEANKKKFELTADEIEKIRRNTLEASTMPEGSRTRAILLAEICTLVQDKIPPRVGDSVRALQRISMLLNVKTNIRNIVGNAGMVPVYMGTDFFGMLYDKALSEKTGIRTTGMFSFKGSGTAFKKGFYESWDDFKRGIHTRQEELNRFETEGFKGQNPGKNFNENTEHKTINAIAKKLNGIDRFTSFCLEAGDRTFFEMWMNNSLNNQMRLNGVTEATPEMVDAAVNEALERTWQDPSKMARFVSKGKQWLNGAHIGNYGLGDVVIKFTKTPANIAKAIVDFSPAGFVFAGKKLHDLNIAFEKGQLTPTMQNQAVNSMSKAVTGTLIYLLVIAAASLGVVKLSGDSDDDKDVSNFEKYIVGIPPYSIEFFGTHITYDWMQPFGSTLAIVSEFMENRQDTTTGFGEDLLNAVFAGGEVFTQQSFLKGFYEFFSNSDDNILVGLFSSLLAEPAVFIPQVSSQLASFTDPYRRSTYDSDSFMKSLKQVINKLPGFRLLLPKQVNVMGEDIKNNQYMNPWLAFASPYNTYPKSYGKVADEIYDLYKLTDDKEVMPRTAPKSFSIKGHKYSFNTREQQNVQRDMGQASAEMLEIFVNSKEYKELDDSQKAEAVKYIYGYAYKVAKFNAVKDDYDYELLSDIVGYKDDEKTQPKLTEQKYKTLSDKVKIRLIEEEVFSDTELSFSSYEKAVEYYIKKVK